MALRPLLEIATEDGDFRSLATAVCANEGLGAHMSPAVRPYLLAALVEAEYGLAGRPALVVTADDRSARDLARDLNAYLSPRPVRYYPSRGTGYESHVAPPPHLVGLRIAALDALTGAAPEPVVVASAVALAEAVPEASLRPAGFALAAGDEIDLDAVAMRLVEAGYERVDQVEDRGQFAARGGILDVFGATEDRAVRVELFGDEIESLRWFSTFTQRSLGDAERVELAPAAELAAEHRELAELALSEAREQSSGNGGGERPDVAELLPTDRFQAPLDLIGESTAVIVAAEEEIDSALSDHWDDVTIAMHADDARHLYVEVAEPLRGRAALSISGVESGHERSFRAQRPAFAARSMSEAEGELERELRSGYLATVTFEHRGEAERARYNLSRLDATLLDGGTLPAEARRAHARGDGVLLFGEAALADGFVSPQLRLAVIPQRRLVHRRRPDAPPTARGRLTSFTELRVGDYVVHEDHGIARFAGFETRSVAGVTRDYLQLEYRGEDRVFVPAEQLAKITRYVGTGGAAPQLSALGSQRWEGMKARARRAARDLAGDLLNLYAERRARRGRAFPPDGEWQLTLERAFPYRETADQLAAVDAVKGDMEAVQPMDRLICGDVGYGKTEVALRAAHKAAADGTQVMMLVPTTILAQQHLGTFRERLAELPFRIEMVSRLRRPAENREVLADFAAGKVDILIGTHRLLSRDVRAEELGLLIVDEEQRFGVRQKDLLRQLKLRVDVISLSATPIPRTLQMSLAGLRDISVIETPPEGRRPIRTFVGPYDDALVKRAIEREVERGGQAFFLHNRVETLSETADRLRALCPGVQFAEAHGQMDERELEETMLDFLRGGADCLVATTIIESGLDIPTANTLIVERADELGLAQAYQIRGRVGRSRERAYAYLLYPSAGALTADAAARLATLSDHTELGSGFAIAMRDLEIRGAGNLLGDEQSGHVAAVGFELYCALLDEAVEAERAADGDGGAPSYEAAVRLDLDVDAYVPGDYVPFEAAKIDVHRRIAGARETSELRALRDELADRFGPLPEPVESLLEQQRARIELGRAGARTVEVRGGRLSAAPIELEGDQADALRERLPRADYDFRTKTVSTRVPPEPAARLAAALAVAEGVTQARAAGDPAKADR
ncbi:MAG TPA: transcription-repair coupling factor [Solirubrobacterales bacterium]|nr:transcription-repair coupling factor [Solirubrobacterales bacterium]